MMTTRSFWHTLRFHCGVTVQDTLLQPLYLFMKSLRELLEAGADLSRFSFHCSL